MLIKGIIDCDTINYGKANVMTIMCNRCSFKCDELNGCRVCQNSSLVFEPDLEFSNQELIDMYLKNDMVHGICFQGLEPMDSFSELISFIDDFRKVSDDLIIIYTGYTDSEIRLTGLRQFLAAYPNIIIKFGRFIMNQPHHYDELLGVELASPNQYAERIS